MKNHIIFSLVIALLFLIFSGVNSAIDRAPVKGGKLPPINLPVPKETKERNYLGLSGGSSFRITEIKAEVVIIEIFSLYCPTCVKLGPKKKELYESIENDSFLKGKIKLIGIGAGDSIKEVQEFKRITEVPFPLFPDKDFSVHNALGEVRTPFFIAIRINLDRTHQVIYSEAGGFKETKEFLELIRMASGLT